MKRMVTMSNTCPKAGASAAQIMAAHGKRAILSSQNAFKAASPELWKERKPKGCPVAEDEVAAQMKAAGVRCNEVTYNSLLQLYVKGYL